MAEKLVFANLNESFLKAKIQLVCNYLNQVLKLSNAHLVNFIDEEQFVKLVPERIREDILKYDNDEWMSYVKNGLAVVDVDETTTQFDLETSTLDEFVAYSLKCQLDRLRICVSLDDLNELERLERKTDDRLVFDRYANEKKTHEVEVLADLVRNFCKRYSNDLVVDVGSGKGYLGSFLALQHGLDVIAIDSCNENTENALKRNSRLQKSWTALQSRAHLRSQGEVPKRRRNNKGRTPESRGTEASSVDGTIVDPVTASDSNRTGSYVGVTQFLNKNVSFEDVIHENGFSRDVRTIGVVGLHTCGNLASRMLETFVRSPLCQWVCSVGCCYHLIEEKYSRNPYISGDNLMEQGFPVSFFLNEQKFALGRNARMLACQSLDRQLASEIAGTSSFFRALLHKLLVDKYGERYKKVHVGKLSKKSSNFTDYVRNATTKLEIEQFSIEEVQRYVDEYQNYGEQMTAFCRLRCLIAPAIEALVLMDRLCYLSEQENIIRAYLVRLYDPVISPRCFAIIGVKS